MLQGGVGSTRCLRLPTRSSRFPGTCDGPVGLCHWQFRTKSSSLQGKNTRNQSNGNGVSTAFPRLAFLHSTKSVSGHGLSAESSSCGLSADAFQAGDAHHPSAPLIPQLALAPRDHPTQRCARPSPKPHKHGDDGFRQQSPVGAAVSGCKRLRSQRLSSQSLGGKSRSCHEHLSMTHSCHSCHDEST